MLLILVEVSVKVAYQSTTLQSYLHAIYSDGSICERGRSVHDTTELPPCYLFWWIYLMLLIVVEVYVKMACQSTTATHCSHRANSMLLTPVEIQTAGTELSPWKYL